MNHTAIQPLISSCHPAATSGPRPKHVLRFIKCKIQLCLRQRFFLFFLKIFHFFCKIIRLNGSLAGRVAGKSCVYKGLGWVGGGFVSERVSGFGDCLSSQQGWSRCIGICAANRGVYCTSGPAIGLASPNTLPPN